MKTAEQVGKLVYSSGKRMFLRFGLNDKSNATTSTILHIAVAPTPQGKSNATTSTILSCHPNPTGQVQCHHLDNSSHSCHPNSTGKVQCHHLDNFFTQLSPQLHRESPVPPPRQFLHTAVTSTPQGKSSATTSTISSHSCGQNSTGKVQCHNPDNSSHSCHPNLVPPPLYDFVLTLLAQLKTPPLQCCLHTHGTTILRSGLHIAVIPSQLGESTVTSHGAIRNTFIMC